MAVGDPEGRLSGHGVGSWAVSARNGLYVRKDPTIKSETVATLQYKEVIVALERMGQWLRHKKGWSFIGTDAKMPLLTRLVELSEIVVVGSEGSRIKYPLEGAAHMRVDR
ncbi:hypothetical protein AAMO2058_001276900 [Amorphochlora amoebiformis]|uniref:Uncharacterized protein n=1 Tax=Amorphochlora amoebiformis TaxID=1561963 RepID=A0A6T6WLK4_9EUKA|mmetsp:Transcript_29677/g.47391  ORF Transcript_29677/g.47391 Transcript_29677/m.47391 type:complete len:110 (+) Transcript_29677:18-347(+)